MATEPTIAKLRHLYQNMVNGAVRDTASAKRIAEGLLAPAIEELERGTPPAVAGEQVAWVDERAIGWLANSRSGSATITTTLGKQKSFERPMPLHTTPQPTHAQAQHATGAKSFQTYAEANAYSKGYYAGKKAATQAQAGAVPLTDEQIDELIAAKHFRKDYELKASDKVCINWYRMGLRDGEQAHGIKET
jgi:hypothetical protein